MSQPIYRSVFTAAWELAWKHKILWIFGLLSLFVGQFGLGNFIGHLVNWTERIAGGYNWMQGHNFSLPELTLPGAIGLIWLFSIMLALGVLVLVVAVISQGALTAATCDWNKKGKLDSLGKAWHKGAKRFWPVLGVNVLEKLALGVTLALFIVAFSGFVDYAGWAGVVLQSLVFLLVLLLAMAFSAIKIYAIGYAVEDNKKFGAALAAGYRLFSHHLLVSLELSFLTVLINWAAYTVIVIGGAVLAVPAAIAFAAAGLTGAKVLLLLGSVMGAALFMLFLAILGALFNTFMTGVWISAFMKMKNEGVWPRLWHYAGKLFGLK